VFWVVALTVLLSLLMVRPNLQAQG
jgi:hypothetical protein